MPNVNHNAYVMCPYFESEKNVSISCEDIFRTFECLEAKSGWMQQYCDNDWMKCPYALAMTEAYEKYENGEESALEENKHKALETELKSMAKKLGRAKKKADQMKASNQSFMNENQRLERQRKELYRELRETKEELENLNAKITGQLMAMAQIYEDRLAYLIDTKCEDKTLYEQDVMEWAENKEYALVNVDEEISEEYSGGRITRAWKVVFKEEEDEKDKESEA